MKFRHRASIALALMLSAASTVTARVVGVVEHEGEEDPIYGGGGGGFAPVSAFVAG
jgi:hypothetical protein